MGFSLLGAVVVALAVVMAGAAASVQEATTGKGPVGWDSYRQLDRLPELPRGVETRQSSSFDRTGGNDDGFLGTYSCLRHSASGCVIAEHRGPGEIASIWSTRVGKKTGDVRPTGRLRVVLDGRAVIDAPLADAVAGKLGPPFVFPLVATAEQSSGGVYLKVPMPFRESMLIETEHNPFFYHVTYRVFADAEGVEPFDPSDDAADVVEMLRSAGTRDPKPPPPATTTTEQDFSLSPGQTTVVGQLQGPGLITALRLSLPQVVGPPHPPGLLANGLPAGRAGSGKIAVAVDPRNAGVRITRRAEPTAGAQVAPVWVDGTESVRFSPPRIEPGTWQVVQVLQVSPVLAAGQSELTLSDVLIAPGVTYAVDSLIDGTAVRSDAVRLQMAPTTSATPVYEPAVGESDALLHGTRLRITFDGRRTVDAPIGEFFGSGLGEYPVSALLFALDPDGWYSSWWPMPYARGATIELFNGSHVPIELGRVEVTSARDERWAQRLSDGATGYFRAGARSGLTEPGRDWAFLDTVGEGKLVGVSHTMEGAVPHPSRPLVPNSYPNDVTGMGGYLEGDERAYVDASHSPSLHGSGTEDFYEGGWYFDRGPFSNFANGHSAHERQGQGCVFECDAAYRLMIADAVPFHSRLRFGIEHGGGNEWRATYGSTAFWYAPDRS